MLHDAAAPCMPHDPLSLHVNHCLMQTGYSVDPTHFIPAALQFEGLSCPSYCSGE